MDRSKYLLTLPTLIAFLLLLVGYLVGCNSKENESVEGLPPLATKTELPVTKAEPGTSKAIPADSPAPPQEDKKIRLKLLSQSWRVSANRNYLEAEGEVKNVSDREADFTVSVDFYDENGKRVSFTNKEISSGKYEYETSIDPLPLPPGETATFRLSDIRGKPDIEYKQARFKFTDAWSHPIDLVQ